MSTSSDLTKFMAGIRQIESTNRYDAMGPVTRYGRATGAYQFLDSTWGGYRGYRRAVDAPRAVQDARARQLMSSYYRQFGRWDLVAVAWHAGPGTAAKVKSDPSALNGVGDGLSTTRQYVDRALRAAGLPRSGKPSGKEGKGREGGGRSGSRKPRRTPWKIPPNTVGANGRLTVDTDKLHHLSRDLTGHLAVLESVRRRSSSVGDELDRIVLEDEAEARRIRSALDTALGEHGVVRARDALVRDIGYVIEARERALGADRTDRDHRRVVERVIASVGPGAATVATRRKVRSLLRGLYEPASSGGGGGSGGNGGGGGRGFAKPVAAPLTSSTEFGVRDAEGAPSRNGGRYHAAKDWFAPGGTAVSSPIAGRIVEVKPSRGNSGQIYGGVVKVQGGDGKVWVFRHVDPKGVKVGDRVGAGDRVATVTDWTGGSDHVHIEHWKTLSGGYEYENMLDPMASLRKYL